MAYRYFGPYSILRKISTIVYELQLPAHAKIHPVFHVSLLKKAVGDFLSTSTEVPPVTDDGLVILEPEAVIDTRWLKRRGKLLEQSLVRWKHLPMEDATWGDTTMLHQQFPNLTLEDKGILRGGGNDRQQMHKPRRMHEPRRSRRMSMPNPKFAT